MRLTFFERMNNVNQQKSHTAKAAETILLCFFFFYYSWVSEYVCVDVVVVAWQRIYAQKNLLTYTILTNNKTHAMWIESERRVQYFRLHHSFDAIHSCTCMRVQTWMCYAIAAAAAVYACNLLVDIAWTRAYLTFCADQQNECAFTHSEQTVLTHSSHAVPFFEKPFLLAVGFLYPI